MGSIFERRVPTPREAREVAESRLGDAECLRESHSDERANGAMYLGGYVIEILLKAKLIERHLWLMGAQSPKDLDAAQRSVWRLCYREHDLEELLALLPEVSKRLSDEDQRRGSAPGASLDRMLKKIAGEWTIYARYSALKATMEEAAYFLERVKEIKGWLQ